MPSLTCWLCSSDPQTVTTAMSAVTAPAPSLSAALSSLPSAASFAVQCDWEMVLREYNTARTAGGEAAAQRLPKESRQFWISAARFDQEQSHCEAVAHLDSELTGAASAAAAGSGSSAAATAAAASATSSAAASSLTAAARSVRLRPEGDADASTMDLQFRNPLQLLAHYPSLSLTQLLQAPRATHSHLHPKGDVFTVDVSAQGNRGLSGGADGSLRVWDAQTALLRADLSGHHGDVTLARWFPSGVVALSAGLDVAVRIWAVEPRAALATQLVGHQRPVTAVCFVGRGRTLVTASEDGTARLWDVSTQQTVAAYPAHKEEFPEPVRDALLLDPQSHPVALAAEAGEPSEVNGHLLLTACGDGIVRGYDMRTQGQVMMLPSGGRAGGIESLAPGPGLASFTLGTAEGAIAVIDLRNKLPIHTMRQDDASITQLRPWNDDSFWATTSTGSCNLWRMPAASSSSPSPSPSIVAQLTGVDCEPIFDLCTSSAFAFVASHNAVRSYAFAAWPASAKETEEFHGMQLPVRKSVPAEEEAAAAASAASATSASASSSSSQ